MRCLGIDPGKTGGFALLVDGQCVDTFIMPVVGKEVDFGAIANWIDARKPTLACIEKVGAMPGQGVTSMFSFGFVTGGLHGILAAFDIPTRRVHPKTWKKLVLDNTKKDKDAAVAHVRRAYPNVELAPGKKRVPHLGITDAVCIAEFGWRSFK
jgi:crossover junction endodeoxyribonuclease RuvC